jgi:RimJ/RimL family protein N-acetyltransferase
MKILHHPTLLDCVRVCHCLPEDEVRQAEAFSGLPFDPEYVAAQAYAQPEPFKFCAVDDEGHAIAVGGYVEQRPGVYRSYMLVADGAWERDGRALTLGVKRVMRDMFKAGAHRLETFALANRHQAHRWYEVLGMRREGRLHCYGAGGEDAVIYAAVKRPPKE